MYFDKGLKQSVKSNKVLLARIPDERDYIMRSFKRHVYRLMRLTKSSDVLEYAYNHYATAEQRDFLVKQLYGRVFRNCEVCNL